MQHLILPQSIPVVKSIEGLRLFRPGAAPADVGPVEAQLIRLGFTFGVPERLAEADARADADACTDMACPQCGNVGMLWRPYVHGEKYRAVASCPGCALQEEV